MPSIGTETARCALPTGRRIWAFLGDSGDRVKLGGPMLSEDGSRMIGSMLVIEAESLQEARNWAAGDPYKKADLFASVDIRPWKAAVGTTTIT